MKKEFEHRAAQQVHKALARAETPEEEVQILSSLVKVLSESKALNRSEGIMYALRELLDREEGIIKADVVVRERLDTRAKSELKEALKSRYNAKDVFISEQVDERVLGGIKVKVGEEVYDATVKNTLNKLAQKLKVTK